MIKHILDFDSSSSPLKMERGSGDPDLENDNCDTYDVFISYRGEVTNFTSHVHTALSRKQIKAFIDSKDLRTGDEICGSLLKAIETSKLYLVIFSPGYGSSRWCLLELENILRCCRQHGKTVIPVFYKVDPCHVRYQTGSFGHVFASKHEGKEAKEKVPSWRAALKEAADINGLHLEERELESEFIDKIVADILRKLNLKPQLPLSVPAQVLVGVSPHIENIVSLLCMDSPQVRSVGIWGMDGMGKTTIAESVFSCIDKQFDGYYFFGDVGEELTRFGKDAFLNKLLSKILEGENSSFGINLRLHSVKHRLARKKVFIVFDDVDDSIYLKLQELAEHHELFGMGSKILMTSRDRGALEKLNVDKVYECVGLKDGEALKLFCLKAFRKERPPGEYLELSSRVVHYAQGNALALTVLGSELFNRDEAYWDSALKNIEKFPNKKSIIDLLRISYDGLSREQKEVFLDIVCFFKGEDADQVQHSLNDCYDCVYSIMVNLVDKSLISISRIRKIEVHDLVQEMGLMMVDEEEVSDDPGKHKRLYNSADICRVLTERRGTETIQGISLNLSEGRNMNFELDAFSKMVNLRWLKIYRQNGQDVLLPETQRMIDFQRWPMRILRRKKQVFFPHLRLLSWEGCPLKSLPSTFNAQNLVTLNLRGSKVERLWTGVQHLGSLKSMDLRWSQHLIEIPDMSGAKNIERMDLFGCRNLKRVHPSVQHLNKLEVLDLSYCYNLSEIPSKLESKVLREFKTTGCVKIREFPEIFPNSLSSISLTASESKTFPDLVGSQENLLPPETPKIVYGDRLGSEIRLTGLGLTELPKVEEWEVSKLIHLNDSQQFKLPEYPRCPVLEDLSLNGNCKLRMIPPLFFNWMPYLHVLDLSRTRIKSLPESLFRLTELRRLFLRHCNLLMKLSPKVGQLKGLQVLDLEGTEIMHLPEEVKELKNLICLKVSFCELPSYRRVEESDMLVISHGTLSALPLLKELSINVSHDDGRWNECVEHVVSEVSGLVSLYKLQSYFPSMEFLSHFQWSGFRAFKLTVGHLTAKRLMPRLPSDAEAELERYDKCLTYIHGDSESEDINAVLRHANAFFLDRHTTIKTLSAFGLENFKLLRCCVVGECNELRVLFHLDQNRLPLDSLEYLYLYYMKNLRSIWEGAVAPHTLFHLKSLTLRTCPLLSSIFTPDLIRRLKFLQEIIIDDCPAITNLVSCNDLEHTSYDSLPRLKRISLHYLPRLTGIFDLSLSRELEWMRIYHCPTLRSLPIDTASNENLKKIMGERSWWESLEWEDTQAREHSWDGVFEEQEFCY